MSEPIKSLRHTDIEQVAVLWRNVAPVIDLSDTTYAADIPGAPSKASIADYGDFYEEPARQEVRALVLRAALTTYAKSLEAAESAVICRKYGLSSSSLMLTYDAAYLAARSFVLFSGFSPIDANSEVSVDVLYSFKEVAKIEAIVEDNFGYFISDRWQHQNLWAITFRIASTTKRTAETEAALKVLRRDKLKSVTKVRNRQTYSSALYAGDIVEEADFPDAIDQPEETDRIICQRYRNIYQSLTELIRVSIDKAHLQSILDQVASRERQDRSSTL